MLMIDEAKIDKYQGQREANRITWRHCSSDLVDREHHLNLIFSYRLPLNICGFSNTHLHRLFTLSKQSMAANFKVSFDHVTSQSQWLNHCDPWITSRWSQRRANDQYQFQTVALMWWFELPLQSSNCFNHQINWISIDDHSIRWTPFTDKQTYWFLKLSSEGFKSKRLPLVITYNRLCTTDQRDYVEKGYLLFKLLYMVDPTIYRGISHPPSDSIVA